MRAAVPVLLAMLAFAGCASAPTNTANTCSIFDQKSGLLTSWRSDAENASAATGVPVSILMATIQAESNFEARAKPPRKWILGFIPWKRPSSAYGYAQALDGTWDHYQDNTGRWMASRSDFSDAIRFVGWYHYQNHKATGIPLNDAYNLYLAYYFGPTGYNRGDWRRDAGPQRSARRAASMAARYEAQLAGC